MISITALTDTQKPAGRCAVAFSSADYSLRAGLCSASTSPLLRRFADLGCSAHGAAGRRDSGALASPCARAAGLLHAGSCDARQTANAERNSSQHTRSVAEPERGTASPASGMNIALPVLGIATRSTLRRRCRAGPTAANGRRAPPAWLSASRSRSLCLASPRRSRGAFLDPRLTVCSGFTPKSLSCGKMTPTKVKRSP